MYLATQAFNQIECPNRYLHVTTKIQASWTRKVLDLSQDAAQKRRVYKAKWLALIMFSATIQRFSNGKITFQSFFMSITVHPFTAAAPNATSS